MCIYINLSISIYLHQPIYINLSITCTMLTHLYTVAHECPLLDTNADIVTEKEVVVLHPLLIIFSVLWSTVIYRTLQNVLVARPG